MNVLSEMCYLFEYEIIFFTFFAIELYIWASCWCGTLQAFRRLYEEVGLGWVYAITKYEPVSLPIIFLIVKPLMHNTEIPASWFYCWKDSLFYYRLQKLPIPYMVFGLNTVFKLQVNAEHINNFAPNFPLVTFISPRTIELLR